MTSDFLRPSSSRPNPGLMSKLTKNFDKATSERVPHGVVGKVCSIAACSVRILETVAPQLLEGIR
jgi:hypothetical protein